MANPSARRGPDMGPTINLGAMAAPLSTDGLDDPLANAGTQHGISQVAGQLPPLRNPGTEYEFVDDERVDDLTPEQIEAELKERAESRRVLELRHRLQAERAKDREIAEARAAVPTHDPVRDAPQTWILMPKSGPEAALCEEWVAEHCPVKIEQNAIVTVLDLAQLRSDDAVMCMVRGKGKRRILTLMKQEVDELGHIQTREREPSEHFAQMVLTPAVRCRDHWRMNGSLAMGRAGGGLDFSSFVSAIGAQCSPLAPRWADGNECKGGQLPRLLELREV
jgi:hypothetical protein